MNIVRVRDHETSLIIPMIWLARYTKHKYAGQIWICGVNKDILKSYGIEVLECKRLNMIVWAYLVDEKKFKAYLTKHNLPLLLFKF